ncbi:UDP-N-acetylmuramate dehydrogenase [Vibrio sp. IRLE0018]|uniref:UDP-N-acetylmuramate dehydrogenase n=1 Tax=Vibrio TaxID=662 RepID=UPI001592F383|nr:MULTISPECIES: UDP-N-acetylmuramate dehydrogenase [Vibrio]MCF8781096.1 UDP-N-acetylmuramate dehydrogenase [Vibrio floridensis]NVC65258.1 UDP-N-acetylmuramate dehydrogenase [Vibrio sp. 05-20-BW147]
MQIQRNVSLKPYHTFSIDQTCDYLIEVESTADLVSVYSDPRYQNLPKLILGKGSNVLFTEPYRGLVLRNRLMGKVLIENTSHYFLHISAGEDWPNLVKWCVNQGIGGLENLALIPGCAGSAPIQNIGAYGVEFRDVCDYVDVLMLDDFSHQRLSAEECLFDYRDSIFKHDLFEKAIITAVGIKLPKVWQANISYGPLQKIDATELTPKSVYETVCQIRQEKLPDPNKVGNAGSFFKNPLISQSHWQRIQRDYPTIVAYPAGEKMKVAAGWLIDQCGLKGHKVGGAQVHPLQALVLTNIDQCSAQDVVDLASLICDAVWDKYQIQLEHEVRFMGATSETNLHAIRSLR